MEINLDKSNWAPTTFGAVAKKQIGKVDRDNTDLTRYIKGEHLASEDLHIRSWGELTDEYLGPAFIRRFEAGDILYGSRRTYLRKVAVAHFEGITSNTTFVIKPNEKLIDRRLLPFLILSEGFAQHSIKHSKGSVNPYINWKDIANYPFLLPPKAEQARLAELLWAGNAVVENTYQLGLQLSTAKACTINSFFNTQLKGKNFTKLKDVGRWMSGGTPSKKNKTHWTGLTPWISPKDMKIDLLDDAIDHISHEAASKHSTLVKKGTILIVVRGLILAHTLPIAIANRELAFNQDIKALKTAPGFTSKYIFNFLKYSENRLLSLVSTTSHGTKKLTTDTLLKLKVPNISLQKQVELIREVDSITDAEHANTAKIASAKGLQKSLINQIF